MNNAEAISIMKNEMECVKRADSCGRNCAECELVKTDTEILTAYEMAISALQTNIVLCKDCVNHGQCSVEDTMRFARLSDEQRFCSVGKAGWIA